MQTRYSATIICSCYRNSALMIELKPWNIFVNITLAILRKKLHITHANLY